MELLLAITVGGLYAGGFFMLLRRSFVKVIIGLALISHAANLFLFAVGGLTRGRAPLLSDDGAVAATAFADPLPQALILTAIVIGFGFQAFAIVLFKRTYQSIGTDDLDRLKSASIGS